MLVILLQSVHYIMNPPSDKYGLDMEEGAFQSGGEFPATSGELHWDPQPATLDNLKSGMHRPGSTSSIRTSICARMGAIEHRV